MQSVFGHKWCFVCMKVNVCLYEGKCTLILNMHSTMLARHSNQKVLSNQLIPLFAFSFDTEQVSST